MLTGDDPLDGGARTVARVHADRKRLGGHQTFEAALGRVGLADEAGDDPAPAAVVEAAGAALGCARVEDHLRLLDALQLVARVRAKELHVSGRAVLGRARVPVRLLEGGDEKGAVALTVFSQLPWPSECKPSMYFSSTAPVIR